MSTFRKSLRIGKKSKQIEENLKKLDEELKKTGALENTESVKPASENSDSKKYGWREVIFEEKNKTTNDVILTSPNGTKYKLIVDNFGNLSTVAI